MLVAHTITRGVQKRVSNKKRREMAGQDNDPTKDKTRNSTVEEYINILNHLGKFACRVGDYRTALICDRNLCPFNPHPADPVTIIMYYYWKSQSRTDVLMHPVTNLPVIDTQNRTIMCSGDWNSPSGIDKSNGALRMLHDAYESCYGRYTEPCTDCLTLNKDVTHSNVQMHASCTKHANQPVLVCGGDPLDSNCIKSSTNLSRAPCKKRTQ